MFTVTNVSFLSSQPAQDVSGSKIYVLFGMNVTMLLLLLQLSTSFDLISLQNKRILTTFKAFILIFNKIKMLFFSLKILFTVSQTMGFITLSQCTDKHKIFTNTTRKALPENKMFSHYF